MAWRTRPSGSPPRVTTISGEGRGVPVDAEAVLVVVWIVSVEPGAVWDGDSEFGDWRLAAGCSPVGNDVVNIFPQASRKAPRDMAPAQPRIL
jgi:hypothetical protein